MRGFHILHFFPAPRTPFIISSFDYQFQISSTELSSSKDVITLSNLFVCAFDRYLLPSLSYSGTPRIETPGNGTDFPNGRGEVEGRGWEVSEWRQDSGETGKSNAFLTSDRWMLLWEKTVCHMKTVIREWERRTSS
ncbi:hypothetical protein TNCV_2962061 [Trichonephila clavipes]|nr:hypothetical protein TNCV_2962061 [Trichonephila clavipes]